MKLLHEIADFISGGELSFQRNGWSRSRAFRLEQGAKEKDLIVVNHRLSSALRKIAEQETPNANATVSRMANIARTALDTPHD